MYTDDDSVVNILRDAKDKNIIPETLSGRVYEDENIRSEEKVVYNYSTNELNYISSTFFASG